MRGNNPLFGTRVHKQTSRKLTASEKVALELENSQAEHIAKGGTIKRGTGGEQWKNAEGRLHRLDGPAFKNAEASIWYENGSMHRIGGPALIHIDGSQEWWHKGKLHREDGPAIICEGEEDQFWLNNKRVEEKDIYSP